eukprot:scaffold5310_cov378-Prasinococcus_capsulatus_cf.AAC.10
MTSQWEDPERRICPQRAREHSFFLGTNWAELEQHARHQKAHPSAPFVPALAGPLDTSHFPTHSDTNTASEDVRELAAEWEGEVYSNQFIRDWDLPPWLT